MTQSLADFSTNRIDAPQNANETGRQRDVKEWLKLFLSPISSSSSGNLTLELNALRDSSSSSLLVQDEPLPDTAAQLVELQRLYRLNKTELRKVCRVSRQNVYDWLSRRFEATGRNRERLARLYRLARSLAGQGAPLLLRQAVEQASDGGESLVDLLSAEELDEVRVHRVTSAASRISQRLRSNSASARRERLGWRPLSEEEERHNLEQNLDDYLDG